MAHHGDAVGMSGHGFPKLLSHLFVGPARKHVVDLSAGVCGGLLGAVIDDGAKSVAFRAANEEAQVHFRAPFVAQSPRLRGWTAPMIAVNVRASAIEPCKARRD